jgi:hypothetical protein
MRESLPENGDRYEAPQIRDLEELGLKGTRFSLGVNTCSPNGASGTNTCQPSGSGPGTNTCPNGTR